MTHSIAIQSAWLNRQRLKKNFSDSLMIFVGGHELTRSNDTHYPFRQFSDFLHLSAWQGPEARLILHPKGDILFVPRINDHHRLWVGDIPSPSMLRSTYRFKRVLYLDQFSETFCSLSKSADSVCAPRPLHSELRSLQPGLPIKSMKGSLAHRELRCFKNRYEVHLLQKISDISSQAHIETISSIQPGQKEFQVQGVFESHLFRHGIRSTAYPSIVATGANSSVLHYTKNSEPLRRGQWLLIDAGGELEGYAADITRTVPVSGKFSKSQRAIYDIVLDAQLATIAAAAPEVLLDDLQTVANLHITSGLRELGLLKGSLDDLMHERLFKLFFPHGVSHMLGLDVHDTSPSRREPARPENVLRSHFRLKEQYVITVEPGLYFIPTLLAQARRDPALKNFVHWPKVDSYLESGGVRIEDDILITSSGCKVLTSVPKQPDDIERLMCRTR